MRVARGMVLLATACAIGGCSASEHDQVEAKVNQFVKAAADRQYKTICDQVLAPSLLDHLATGGIPCEQAMQIALASVNSPTLSIGTISVDGNKASALTLSGARGQVGALAAIELVKTRAGWRVSGLGAPLPPAKH